MKLAKNNQLPRSVAVLSAKWLGKLSALMCGVLLLASPSFADDPIPTPVWTDFYGTVSVEGSPAPIGSVVEAFDSTGVICGRFIVSRVGSYGFMPVYGDDSQTPSIDEGMTQGEVPSFTVNGVSASLLGPSDGAWVTGPTTPKNLNLAIGAVTYGLEPVNKLGDLNAIPLELVEVTVEFRNTGNVTDFFSVSASSFLGWEITAPDAIYVNAGAIGSLTFTVLVPADAKDVADQVDYTVASGLAPSLTIGGSFNIFVISTGVGDEEEIALPSAFTLGQNYPNPFNPKTNIPFSLNVSSDVTLTVYDITGRKVETQALGVHGVGDHVVEFKSDSYSSGIYLYKLSAGEFSQTRSMILLK